MNELTSPTKARESTGSMFIKMMEHDKPNKLEPCIYQTKKNIINASGAYPERKMNHQLQPSILQGFMGISVSPWIVQTALDDIPNPKHKHINFIF